MPRLQIYAPKRDQFTGIRVAGYFWPDAPPTIVEVTEEENDGPHEEKLRRVTAETYARLVQAQQVGRLIIIPDGGQQAEIDKQIIAEQGEQIVWLKSALAESEAKAASLGQTVAELRGQAQADARTLDVARQEAAVQLRRADDLASKLREISKREPAAQGAGAEAPAVTEPAAAKQSKPPKP